MADDISQGQLAQAQALEIDRKRYDSNVARNALVAQFGPAYSDPDMAAKAAQANNAFAMTPVNVAHTQAATANTQASTTQLNNANALFPIQQQTAERANDAGIATQRRQQMGTAVTAMSDALAGGKTKEEAWDIGSRAIQQQWGIGPEKLAPYKEQYDKDPQGSVAAWSRDIAQAEFGSTTPTERATIRKAANEAGEAAAKRDGTVQANHQAFFKTLGVDSLPDAHKKVAGFNNAATTVNTTLDAVKEAQDLMKKVPKSGVWRSGSSYLSSSEEGRLHEVIKTIKANAAFQAIRSLKDSGVSLGALSEKELATVMDSQISVGVGSNFDSINKELNRIKKAFTLTKQDISPQINTANQNLATVQQYLNTRVQAPGGAAPVTPEQAVSPFLGRSAAQVNPNQAPVNGVTPSAAPGAIREGSTATNPGTGAKLVYKGGQWQPQ